MDDKIVQGQEVQFAEGKELKPDLLDPDKNTTDGIDPGNMLLTGLEKVPYKAIEDFTNKILQSPPNHHLNKFIAYFYTYAKSQTSQFFKLKPIQTMSKADFAEALRVQNNGTLNKETYEGLVGLMKTDKHDNIVINHQYFPETNLISKIYDISMEEGTYYFMLIKSTQKLRNFFAGIYYKKKKKNELQIKYTLSDKKVLFASTSEIMEYSHKIGANPVDFLKQMNEDVNG